MKHNLNRRGKVIVIAGLNEHNQLVGWLMVSKSKKYIENHFNMVVGDKYQRRGIGRALLSMAKEIYDELYAVVVPANNFKKRDGRIYPSPLNFYRRNGFELTGKKYIE